MPRRATPASTTHALPHPTQARQPRRPDPLFIIFISTNEGGVVVRGCEASLAGNCHALLTHSHTLSRHLPALTDVSLTSSCLSTVCSTKNSLEGARLN
ncbi:hypothetical protein E2C01_024748 [Portunus trituberculatus]|uniref:Uncharacterized protein n=1 Tax=Portunus trituberculatus TaxID=210409 RepID=A0A5B7ED78_PORTR|nr:hypothetical protein [Portunus trituberculatus]